MRCLIVSPVPTVPDNQGNAVCIVSRARLIQSLGISVHFVFSKIEGANPSQISMMASEWDSLDVLPYYGNKVASHRTYYGLDDWYDPLVSEHIRKLVKRWKFDFALVNYVWMSAAFEALDSRTLKILETHDKFSDRQFALMKAGLTPTWYYTNVAEEARGLSRADVVLAVQRGEADAFRAMTDRRVEVIGLITPLNFLEYSLAPKGAKLNLGYIGSANLTNQSSVRALIRELDRRPAVSEKINLFVAGPICSHLPRRHWITPIGEIADPRKLYERVDCIVNPDIGGSGLKIKSVEALSFGLPLISTLNGADGLGSGLEFHGCRDQDEVVEQIVKFMDQDRLNTARTACRSLIVGYQNAQRAAFRRVFAKAVPKAA